MTILISGAFDMKSNSPKHNPLPSLYSALYAQTTCYVECFIQNELYIWRHFARKSANKVTNIRYFGGTLYLKGTRHLFLVLQNRKDIVIKGNLKIMVLFCLKLLH